MNVLQLTSDLEVAYLGPPLEKGRLPAVFYLALSAEESLDLNPYNQPALYLLDYDVRIFSLNLPAHGPNLNAIDALGVWAQEFSEGKDPLSPFFDQVLFAIDTLIEKGWIVREKIGFMGLSRGGFVAMHVAKKLEQKCPIVGFAPMTELTFAREFESLKEDPTAQALNLIHFLDFLYEKPIRMYIGNRDIAVGTDRCFHFMQALAEVAFNNNLRSPPVEMLIGSSIGHRGHGTSKENFEAGTHWLGKQLGVIR